MIRMAILFLVVANIVLFLWLNAPKSTERSIATLPEPEVGSLVLANEVEPGRHADASPESAEPGPAEPGPDEPVVAPSPEPVAAKAENLDASIVAGSSEEATVQVPPEPDDRAAEEAVVAESAATMETTPIDDLEPVAEEVDFNDGSRQETDPTAADAVPPPEGLADSPRSAPPPVVVDVTPVQESPDQPSSVAEADAPAVVAQVIEPTTVDAGPASEPLNSPNGDVLDQTIVDIADSMAGLAAPSTVSAEDSPPLRPSVCARVGPLSNEEADGLIKALPVYVRLLSDVSEEYSEVDRYYVMIPPLPSRTEGRQMLASLAEAGFTDTWLFPSGTYRNAISLGFFRYEPRATQHANRVNAAGFEAIVEPRVSQREGRWLMLENVDGGAIELTLPLPETASASPQPCPRG